MMGHETVRVGAEPLPEADYMGEESIRAYRTHVVGSVALSLNMELPARRYVSAEPLALVPVIEQPMLPIEVNQ